MRFERIGRYDLTDLIHNAAELTKVLHDRAIHRRAIQLARVCNRGDRQWETKVVRGTRIRARSNEP